jgi:shikimate dehydrogenase
MLPTINRDTRLCVSLSARPSNNGTRFHNFLYRELGLDYVYKAFAITDIAGAVTGIRALGIRGAAVSMPFKEAVMALADEVAPAAAMIGAVNTVLNDDGRLRAFNTDTIAVRQLLDDHRIDRSGGYALLGAGGMAKAVGAALADAGFSGGTVIARNEAAGRMLAGKIGADWRPALGDLRPAFLINATPVGMAGGAEVEDLAFPREAIEAARAVCEAVAMPVETPLVRLARSLGREVIDGSEIMTLQAVEQFALYTGIRPPMDLVARAQAFARAG